MRKFQQLILIVLTILSILILFTYKKENARLKYVLDVVNFFGKNDAYAISKLENLTTDNRAYDLGYPIGNWQFLGSDFHSYSAFSRTGEVIAITIGAKSTINFKCFLRFNDRGKMKGKFRFERTIKEDSNDEFNVYTFRCKYDSPKKVEAVTFVDVVSRAEHTVLVRNQQQQNVAEKINLVVCLDMTNSLDNFATATTIQQFFYHYHILGASEFLVYGANGLTHSIKTLLLRHGIQPNIFPYNFPFQTNSKNRAIIETDCLLRLSNVADFVVIAGLNEYLYTFAPNFKPNTDLNQFFNHYSKDVTLFEIPTRNVCVSKKHDILSENNLAEVLPTGDKFYLHRPQIDYTNYKTITIDAKRLSLNRYANCSETASIFDWRNLIDEQNLKYINTIAHQLQLYISN